MDHRSQRLRAPEKKHAQCFDHRDVALIIAMLLWSTILAKAEPRQAAVYREGRRL
jgi:hypothetical protein